MHVLFVHGMGRTPISGMPILFWLRANGYTVSVFGYSTAFNDFDAIRNRLRVRIIQMASQGDYVLVGHSLGGVLLRSALQELPHGTNPPKHLFLLGSPVRPAILAKKLRKRFIYRAITGDCGQLLASSLRMKAIGPVNVQTTSILGTWGFYGKYSPFGFELNDGVVSESELQADWITDVVHVPVIHTLIPASSRVADIILDRMAARA
jgi:triacylglycerol esterase/lipase EstA (alpha/beta hydrolase family)